MTKPMLNDCTKRLLIQQGFSKHDVENNPNIVALARWTPFLCGICGLIGILLANPYYFFVLGVFTLIGAFRPYSFFDYLYNYIFRYIFNFGDGIQHGIQRKVGCAIGAVAYIVSGLGFYFGIAPMAYIPAIFMVTFAFIAGIFNWCFASTLYNAVFSKQKPECC